MFLLFVTTLPFTTAFLGDYTQFRFPVFIYWVNILMMGIMLYINWVYAYNKGFINEETKETINDPIRKRIIVAQSLYAFGALLCLFSPYLSICFIILIQMNYAFGFTTRIK